MRPPRLRDLWRRRRRVSHVPTILQMEAVECGAASLAMVLAHYGRWVPLEELRVHSGVTRDGATAAGILRAARFHGLEAKGMRLEMDRLAEQRLPLIVFWQFNHFIVVEGFAEDAVFVNDPAKGRLRLTHEEFSRGYTGIALVFAPGPAFTPAGHPPRVLGALLRRLARSPDAVTAIAVASLLIAVPGLVTPLGLKLFVDDVLVRGYADWLFPLVLGLVVAALAGGFLAWFQQRLLVALQTKLDMAIAAEYVWHLLRLPMRFFGQRFAGDLANRMVGARRIAALMAGPLPTTVIAMMVGAVFLVALFFLSPWLTLVALAAIGLHLGVLKLVARRRQELNSRYLVDQGALAGFSAAGLSAIETIRAGGSEQDFYAQWAGHQARLVNSHQRLGEASALLEVGPQFVAVLAQAVILFAGAELILAGRLTMGGLVAFQALWMQVATPVQRFVMLGGQLQTILGDLMRLDDVLRYPLDEGEAAVPRTEPSGPRGEPQPVRITGRLEFRGVSFGYDPTRPPLIDGLDFVLPPGGRIALVGPSGSGKSTVARLILGLLRPSAGEILIDGRPRDAWPAILLERDIAAVDQEIFLFAGTVAENIAFWDPDLRHEAIRRAAEDALIHEDIAARPGGYEAVVEEGGRNFSGGQRQRLEIARALARDPRILVLDEATAALDAKTEEEIDHRLRRRGCSLVIVAHRLSTIRDADEIILLDEGRVAERGRHEDLIALGGRYRQLVEQG